MITSALKYVSLCSFDIKLKSQTEQHFLKCFQPKSLESAMKAACDEFDKGVARAPDVQVSVPYT